jgi:hypothetical protein
MATTFEVLRQIDFFKRFKILTTPFIRLLLKILKNLTTDFKLSEIIVSLNNKIGLKAQFFKTAFSTSKTWFLSELRTCSISVLVKTAFLAKNGVFTTKL